MTINGQGRISSLAVSPKAHHRALGCGIVTPMSGFGARRLGTYHSHAPLPLSICAHVTPPFSKAALGTRRFTRSGAAVARDLASFSASRRVLTLSRGSARSLGACCGRDRAVPSTRRSGEDTTLRRPSHSNEAHHPYPEAATSPRACLPLHHSPCPCATNWRSWPRPATPSLRACGVRDTEFGPLPQNLGRGQQLLSN